LAHVARLGIASILQLRWQYGCVSEDIDRSLASIDRADLLHIAALAADAETELFERNPRGSGRHADRLLGRALCQGAALHYMNGKNGVKDFDVWSFYAQHDDWPFLSDGAERGTSAPRSSAGTPATRRSTPAGAWTFSGAHFRPHPAPTQPMPSTIIWPPGGLTRLGNLQRRQWS
jgi:hypothetical protein